MHRYALSPKVAPVARCFESCPSAVRVRARCERSAGKVPASGSRGAGDGQSVCRPPGVDMPPNRGLGAAARSVSDTYPGVSCPVTQGPLCSGGKSTGQTVKRLPQGGAQRGWWSLAAGSMLSRNRRHWRILDPGKRSELTVAPDSLTHRESTAPARARTGACARGRTAGGGFGAPDFAVIIAPVFDRHFLRVAAVTWIIASRTAAGAAFHASSLPARAGVVTTRLAQGLCRLARTALPQGSHRLAPLRLVGGKMPRAGHARHAWRRTLLIETEGAAGAVERGCTPHECRRSPIATAPPST